MISLNTQPIEKQIHGDGATLEVVGVWPTIQGEGPLVGTPAVFVRTAGCNFACPACDTDYTNPKSRKLYPVEDLVKSVRAQGNFRLVVITGGEPFRQPIGRFANLLLAAGYSVQVETNGSLYQPNFPYDQTIIVCSPKSVRLNHQIQEHINALKYVLSADDIDPDDGLPLSVLGMKCRVARPLPNFPRDQVYVQPIDVGDEQENQRHLKATVDVAMKFGYRLCLQTHKIIGLE